MVNTVETADTVFSLESIQLQPLREEQKNASYTGRAQAITMSMNKGYGSV